MKILQAHLLSVRLIEISISGPQEYPSSTPLLLCLGSVNVTLIDGDVNIIEIPLTGAVYMFLAHEFPLDLQ